MHGEWETTWSGRQFLRHLDNAWDVCIFATDKNYRRLVRCDTVFIACSSEFCINCYPETVFKITDVNGREKVCPVRLRSLPLTRSIWR
jgi:hypothetical protein